MTPLDGLTEASLAEALGVPSPDIRAVAARASSYYRPREIVVGTKKRQLSIPSGDLKALQGALYENVLRHHRWLPPVYCCPGRGVVEAASVHVRHPTIIHLDIRDFFPSVRPARVQRSLKREGVSGSLAHLVTRLVTYNHHLPQGAATSVAIGNLVLQPEPVNDFETSRVT